MSTFAGGAKVDHKLLPGKVRKYDRKIQNLPTLEPESDLSADYSPKTPASDYVTAYDGKTKKRKLEEKPARPPRACPACQKIQMDHMSPLSVRCPHHYTNSKKRESSLQSQIKQFKRENASLWTEVMRWRAGDAVPKKEWFVRSSEATATATAAPSSSNEILANLVQAAGDREHGSEASNDELTSNLRNLASAGRKFVEALEAFCKE